MSMIEPDFWSVLLWLITNSVIAGLLAGLAYFTDRVVKRPTLAHLLWVLVLIKLVTPPMVVLPIAVDASRFEWIAKYTTLDYQRLMRTNAAAVADSIDHARMTGIGQSFGAQSTQTSSWSLSTIWRDDVHLGRRNGWIISLDRDCGQTFGNSDSAFWMF